MPSTTPGPVWLVALALLPGLACLGDNPRYESGGTGSESGGDGDGDTTAGDGDGEPTTGDGDGDGGPDPCANMQLDPGETAVDCGGACTPCDDGLACADGPDCKSQVCVDMICQAPTCADTVHNGDEVAVDCGGPCVLCAHTPLQGELDDFEGTDANAPQAAMFADGSFAVTYSSSTEARVRWFDDMAAPISASVLLEPTLMHELNALTKLAVHDDIEHSISAVELGRDMQSTSADAFLLGRDPNTLAVTFLVNDPAQTMADTAVDLAGNGDRVVLVWVEDDDLFLRRWDYGIGPSGDWVDITPTFADSDPGGFTAFDVSVSTSADGLAVVGWNRCDTNFNCTVVIRRYQDGWLDPAPLTVSNEDGAATSIKSAIAADGRIGVAWMQLGLGEAYPRAAIVTPEFTLDGTAWELQPVVLAPFNLDIEALADGSFAIAWTDTAQDRIHLRRFVGPDTPKLPMLADEATWGTTTAPTWVSLDGVDGRLLVVWSATVDMVTQIQGQVFAY
jgi:hypothetical protein